MELKLFGRKVFEFKKGASESLVFNSQQSLEKSKFLPDFYTMRENQSDGMNLVWVETPTLSTTATEGSMTSVIAKQEKELKKKFPLTPKKIFELKFLNKKDFKINTDKEYVDCQIQQFKDKLDLIKITEFDMSRGTNEIASILIRLENRKKYEAVKSFFGEHAYTTTERINKVIKNHSHLQLGKIEQFIADMPKEAVNTMKDYTKMTEIICKKKPIFYIIADEKDFKKTDKRRDPILLAQSPFGHFWQILGAWSDEMIFLEEL